MYFLTFIFLLPIIAYSFILLIFNGFVVVLIVVATLIKFFETKT